MKLHLFNPEHDVALASGLSNFTAPHAGRQIRADLGFLPALWANGDDVILVDSQAYAETAWGRFSKRLEVHGLYGFKDKHPQFLQHRPYLHSLKPEALLPWGWDAALCATLRRNGYPDELLPADEELARIRLLSHRRTSARLLTLLQMDGTVGEAFECTRPEEVETLLCRYGQVVMKAPWSSSGRGLRFLSVAHTPFNMQAGWFRNVVSAQGSVMVEPYYNKVKDFGMEFSVDNGVIHYEGLSLFHTANGAYVGNIVACEDTKRELLGAYVSLDLLDKISNAIVNRLDLGQYSGLFGVDMMVVGNHDPASANGWLIHPCVEINLRRTMGHVALSLPEASDGLLRVMRIHFDGKHYKLKIIKLR